MGDSAQAPEDENGDNGHGNPESDSSGTNPDAATLDTTLLESLFYNEMMMLGDSSDFLSTITGGGDSQQQTNSSDTSALEKRDSRKGQVDPLTVAEQSLLRDFGVSGGSLLQHGNGDGANSGSEKQQLIGDQQQVSQQPHPDQHQEQQSHPYQPSWSQQYYQHPSQDQNYNPYQNPNHGAHYYQHPYPPPPNHHQQYHDSQPPPPPYYPPPNHQHPYPLHPAPGQPQAPQPPPPPPPQVSRGIKHSVLPKYEPPKHDQSAHSVPSIPNPLSQQQQYAPQHPPHPHQQHPPYAQQQPQPPQHPQQPHQQHYYHGSHPPPTQPYQHHQYPPHPAHPGNAPPNLVPVPSPAAPQPGHHEHSAFGPVSAPPPPSPQPQPHYSSPSPATHETPHPAPVAHPHSHSNTQPPKQQLVSQFATLANRLGINLPPNLLNSLTESAGALSSGKVEGADVTKSSGCEQSEHASPEGQSIEASGKNNGDQHTSDSKHAEEKTAEQQTQEAPVSRPASVASSTSSGALLDSTPPVLNAARKTAEEAVAAVTRKRSTEEVKPTSGDGSDSNSNKPSYTKRRKKPRLSDCESRLEKLREENELLKQHLDNVTNQSQRFEQERLKSEVAMKRMMETEDISDDELNAVIRVYTDMYADYGKRRHQELSFHLEQLQKLANPTNFTKMGLWTIAKANKSKDTSKQNPLIGILQKELSITPQQTRKILDQRAKIRDLCSNLNASLVLLQKLKDLCEQKNKTFNDRINKTREILTPRQVVKLIMFVKDYSDVLGTVCPGWTSEQIVHKKRIPATSNKTAAQANSMT